MSNLKKYDQIFCENLEVSSEQLNGLKYQETELWDSVGHMTLISSIEDAFDIMMETDDIIDFSSYEKGIEILKHKYGIQI
jgi:acyl carrier protein